jgi:hypothetical protein
MPPERLVVRERIAPQITASLFANYRSSVDAIQELIDNAVDSRIGDSPLRIGVRITLTTLEIAAAGGSGMGPQDIERHYLRWGDSPKRGRNLLGQYGQGGKAAIGHLGSRFAIEASRPDDTAAWRFTDPDYRDRSHLKTYELETVAKRVPAASGWVRIRIEGVDKRIDEKRLAQRLASVYRPLLEAGRVEIDVNGHALRPAPIPVDERQPFRVNAGGARLSGWYGVLSEGARTLDLEPGIRCYRNGRLVTEGEFFGHPTPAKVPGTARMIGEVDVPNVAVTMNKSDFDRDSEAWRRVEERMKALLAPLVRRLQRDEYAPPPAGAVRAAEQARRLLAQVLRYAENASLFPGQARAAAATSERAGARAGSEPSKGPPAARVPPPGDATRRGLGNIVVRPLDSAIRSQLVSEEGSTVIIINSRHPLFLERKGDLWYQLETALREVVAVGDASSVADYERRVNDLLLMAMDIRHGKAQRVARARQLAMFESP